MQNITTKNYKTKLSSYVKASNNQAQNLQDIIMFGFSEVLREQDGQQNNNLQVLSEIVLALSEKTRSKQSRVVSSYISSHLTGIKWDATKKRYTKASKKATIEGKYPTFSWWEHESNKENKKVVVFNANKRLQSYINSLEKGIESDNLNLDEALLREQIKSLEAILSKKVAGNKAPAYIPE